MKAPIMNKSGFTLLEILIALVIFAVGILGVATMQISAIKGNSKGRQISEATSVASALMENFLTRDYNDPCLTDRTGDGVAGIDNLWNGRDFPNPNPASATELCQSVPVVVPKGYNLFWNIAEDEPTTGTKTIRIFVEGPQIETFTLDMIRVDI